MTPQQKRAAGICTFDGCMEPIASMFGRCREHAGVLAGMPTPLPATGAPHHRMREMHDGRGR